MTSGRHILFVLGGPRSGKSRYAQARAEAFDGELVFLATAQAFDAEMHDRIARHRADRGPRWRTVEAPLDLASTLATETDPSRLVLVDCLTLWTSNLLLADRDIPAATEALVATLAAASGPVILVANEVGLGIVPDNALARSFRDAAGLLNQAVARAADEVAFLAAGLPLRLK
jgi:adenosylcobinamide kinase/adenosylcobinamide-phosphate guanylyltransferase